MIFIKKIFIKVKYLYYLHKINLMQFQITSFLEFLSSNDNFDHLPFASEILEQCRSISNTLVEVRLKLVKIEDPLIDRENQILKELENNFVKKIKKFTTKENT